MKKRELLGSYGIGIILALVGVLLSIASNALYAIFPVYMSPWIIFSISFLFAAVFLLWVGFSIEDLGTEKEKQPFFEKTKRHIKQIFQEYKK